MSSFTPADLSVVSTLVDHFRGTGYVLNFTDREFRHYFSTEFDVDMEDPRYQEYGTSKGKRLRCFLQQAENSTAARVLKSLWEQRQTLLDGSKDPISNSTGKYKSLMGKLGGAPPPPKAKTTPKIDILSYHCLKREVMALSSMEPHPRGYAFQKFLYGLFALHGLDPKKSFRNRGEEIDGSFEMSGCFYLLEAKWQAKPVGVAELHAFEGKLNEKAPWGRGLFLSYVGFSPDGLEAFGRGKRTLCMDGLDLYEMLDRNLPLDQVLNAKSRRAVETGLPFVRVRDLL